MKVTTTLQFHMLVHMLVRELVRELFRVLLLAQSRDTRRLCRRFRGCAWRKSVEVLDQLVSDRFVFRMVESVV